MSKVMLEGITLLADDVIRLARFYQDVLGLDTVVVEQHYAEFRTAGVRLAICSRPLMAENTNDHSSFAESRKGQAVELNFQCNSPEEVHALYEQFISKGAAPITAPQIKSWGHTTGFFADPEGNIHSIFAINPV